MLSVQNQIICPGCCSEYKDDNLPRILTMCGHTFCSNCIQAMIQENLQQDSESKYLIRCPEQSSEMELLDRGILIFPKNLALMKVLENKKRNNSSFKDSSFDISKIVRQEELAEDEQTKDLITAINEGKTDTSHGENIESHNDSNTLSKSDQGQQQKEPETQICLLHQKPLEIVCILDKEKICSKCAIFGQHKGHEFRAIQQVEVQTKKQYENIIGVFQEKQEIQQRMSDSQTQKELMSILIRKNQKMQKSIKGSFKKLIEIVKQQQQTCLKQLSSAMKETEQKINSLLKIDKRYIEEFNLWEQQSYVTINLLESKEIEPKIDLLYCKQSNKRDIVDQGQSIIKKMSDQENNLIPEVQLILQNLECITDSQLFDVVPQFLTIKNKPAIISEPKLHASNQSIQQSKISIADKLKQLDSHECLPSVIDRDQGSPLLEESLLEAQDGDQINDQNDSSNFNQGNIFVPATHFQAKEDSICCQFDKLELESCQKPKKVLSKVTSTKNILRKPVIKQFLPEGVLDEHFVSEKSMNTTMKTERLSLTTKNINLPHLNQRPSKKKMKSIKIPQKYQKVMDGIFNNSLDTIDLTNGELGDGTVIQICEFIKFSKARTVKLIRNKLSDNGIVKALPSLANASTLNLSQNNLTEAVLDIFIQSRDNLPNLKNLILSQNKIIERKHRAKIEQLKSMGLTVSV